MAGKTVLGMDTFPLSPHNVKKLEALDTLIRDCPANLAADRARVLLQTENLYEQLYPRDKATLFVLATGLQRRDISERLELDAARVEDPSGPRCGVG